MNIAAELTIRPRTADDDSQIVAIVNEIEASGRPLSLEEFRQGAESGGGCWVAAEGGRVLGFVSLDPAWWTGRPDVLLADLHVTRERWHQMIGCRLFDLLMEQLRAREAGRVLAWVREDVSEGMHFVQSRGFVPTGETNEDYTLDLSRADTSALLDLTARLAEEGITITRLADIPDADGSFLRSLYTLWFMGAEARLSFDDWQDQVIRSPGLSPEWNWVARHEGRPVGTTYLKMLDETSAENDWTGVWPDYRGRGIARALKLTCIDWARERGIRTFYTDSKIENVRMIEVNRSLGYEPGARRMFMALDLSPSSS